MKTRLLTVAALAVLTAAALALAACGGSDETSAATTAAATTTAPAGGGETVDFEADPNGQLAYTETDVTAKAGKATIDFSNPSSVQHDVVIEDESGNEIARTDIITDSQTSTTTDLKPGTFTFYCSVDGHRAAGMEGTLTVK